MPLCGRLWQKAQPPKAYNCWKPVRKCRCIALRIVGMFTRATVPRLARIAISLALPQTCMLCGGRVHPDAEWPLCGSCALQLRNERAADARRERCAVCGKPLISRHGRCTRCRASSYEFDTVYPLFRYADDVRLLVLAYKSGGRRSLSGFFAEDLAEVIAARFRGRVVIPVPPRPGKLRRKGWDQVEAIAAILERKHGIPVLRALARSAAAEQKVLNLEERAANMRGTIRLVTGMVVPADPVLFDDILTTGATLSACAACLKSASATRVDAVTIAAD